MCHSQLKIRFALKFSIPVLLLLVPLFPSMIEYTQSDISYKFFYYLSFATFSKRLFTQHLVFTDITW